MRNKALAAVLLFGLAACGGGDDAPAAAPSTPAADAPAAAAPAAADWFVVDEAAQTVTINLVAGQTSDNNYWNYNGFYGGRGGITVPEGFQVTINFENRDPAMAHSVGVGERQAAYPTTFQNPEPVFAGAISSNPTSMTAATMPGQAETITFTADAAGEYALICYIAGHAVTGMWMPFTVSADGSYGIAQ
jgi:FtsP/CotA-like multicopper oxidase with cupredoxin domain